MLLKFSVIDYCLLQTDGEESICNLECIRNSKGKTKVAELRLDLQKTMQKHAAVFRTADLMKEGYKKVRELYKKLADIKVA